MKRTILSLIILALVLLSACSLTTVSKGEEEAEVLNDKKTIQLNIDIESIIEEYEDYRLAVHFPQTSNDQLNQVVMDYVKKSIAEFKQDSYQLKQEKSSDATHELNIDYDMLHTTEGIVSIAFQELVIFGEESTSVGNSVLNFDVSNGKRLKLDKLFRSDSDYLNKLSELVVDQLLTHEKLGTSFDEDWIKRTIFPVEESFEQFSLDSNGMTFYYQLSEEHTGEAVKVTVPEQYFKNIMKEKYFQVMKQNDAKPPATNLSAFPKGAEAKGKPSIADTDSRKLALTFDDGPHRSATERVLEALEDYNAKATFFVLGNRLAYYPEIVKSIDSSGHEIGNHSWSHRELTRLKGSAIEEQLQRTDEVLQALIGKKTALVKPPYGHSNLEVKQAAGIPIVQSSHVIETWKFSEPEALIAEVMDHAEEGAIISLQEMSPYIEEVIEPLLKRLTEEGYQLVTVSELISEEQSEIADQPSVLSWLP